MQGMSDSARVVIEEGAAPVSREAWLTFCNVNGLSHYPEVLGGQMFQGDGVRASFAPAEAYVYRSRVRPEDSVPLAYSSREIVFSTYPGSPKLGRIAALARAARGYFGGRIEAGANVAALLSA